LPGSEPRRNFAWFKPHWNNENGVFWLFVGKVESLGYLPLHIATFGDGGSGQAYQNSIASADGSTDLGVPVLSWEYLLFI